jgi:hypothetical protein
MSVKNPRTAHIKIRTTQDRTQDLRDLSEVTGLSVTAIIEHALDHYLARRVVNIHPMTPESIRLISRWRRARGE